MSRRKLFLVALLAVGVASTRWVVERTQVLRCQGVGSAWSSEEDRCVGLRTLSHPDPAPPVSEDAMAGCAEAAEGEHPEVPGYWPPDAFRVRTAALRRAMPRDPRNLDSLSAHLAASRRRWYAGALCAMGEAPLSAPDEDGTRVRLLWLPSFHPGVAVRVEHRPGETELTVIELDGAGGYAPGTVARRERMRLTEAQWRELQALLERAGFWRSESALPSTGLDGAQWIVEVSEPNRYHVVDRWGGSEVGRFLLGATGLDFDPVY